MFGDQNGLSIENIASILMDLVKVGKVTSTNDGDMCARVQFQDRDGIVSHKLRVVVPNTSRNKDYCMPDIGEQVLCLFLPIGVEQGYILGSFYSTITKPTVASKNKRRVDFEDGTVIEYDRATHNLLVDCVGDVTVRSVSQVTIDAPQTVVTGKLDVEGLLTYSAGMVGSGGAGSAVSISGDVSVSGGDVVADGVSLKTHTHPGDSGGSTGTPN